MQPTILIIDDERQFAEMLGMRLAAHGYLVTSAHDGGQGIALARKHKPDLVLLDKLLPDMDGAQVAQTIRADKTTAGTPIIFLTAMLGEENRARNSFADGDILMPKTAGPVRLLETIRECLGQNHPPRS